LSGLNLCVLRLKKWSPSSRIGRLSSLDTFLVDEAMMNSQVATIRAEIMTHGESIANCAKLLALCPEVAISGQWGEIAKIAIAENWSFTFFPNGDVRFAAL
jgi:hypothetical protein